jgi:hypothetical protein
VPLGTLTKESTMNRRLAPFLAAVLMFATGLALGAGKSADDTSAANTASKILLAAGVLLFVAAAVTEAVRRIRTRHAAVSR